MLAGGRRTVNGMSRWDFAQGGAGACRFGLNDVSDAEAALGWRVWCLRFCSTGRVAGWVGHRDADGDMRGLLGNDGCACHSGDDAA
jgi:hypothetical protein